MGIDTKADDWFIAAHRLKVNTTTGTGSMSFKIGSKAAAQAALIGCSGSVSGTGVPGEMFFALSTAWLRSISGPWSLKDIKGDRGSVWQNVPSDPGTLSVAAFRSTGAVMFNADMPNSEKVSFQITGGWMVKQIFNLGSLFNI